MTKLKTARLIKVNIILSAPDYLKSVAQFINTGQYTQAINLLNTIEDRNARWYYLSALANAAVGKWNVAQDHIRTAYAKEPDNMTYHQAYSDITNGINPLKKDPFSSFFDFGDTGGAHTYTYTSPNQNTRTYTARRGGCVSRILKIILIIIIAVSFSVSLGNKNKKAERFDKDAGNVCINYIKKYGAVKWEALDEAKYGENKAKLTGLCYARQMDFNGDKSDELMICYNDNNVYYLEVWGYHGGKFVQLYKEEANSSEKVSEGYWTAFYRKGDRYLICKSDKSKPSEVTLYSLHHGKFKKSGNATYDIASATYSIGGKDLKDKFETIELSCLRKSKAEVTVDLVSSNIDAFGNISSQAITNTLNEKERKANAYYEVVKKRIDKYGDPSIKSDNGEKYIDGLAYVRQIDFDGDGNMTNFQAIIFIMTNRNTALIFTNGTAVRQSEF